MTLQIAFDQGPGIGLGHRRRVEALAHELARLGIECRLTALNSEPVTSDVVLVDSYRLRADDRSRIDAHFTIAIDDVERDLAVDLVIDPDPGADGRVHERAGAVLAGAPYALIDPTLRMHARAPIETEARRVLVTTGASDSAGIGARLATELANELTDVEVRLVVGPWGRTTEDHRVRVVDAPVGLAAELEAADVVVTAGGVTMLEACCLGRPTVAISIAANQDRAIAGAAHAGAVLAADMSSATGVAVRLAQNFEARLRLGVAAAALVDGQGATRVAAAISAIAFQDVHSR